MIRRRLLGVSFYYFVFISFCTLVTSVVFQLFNATTPLLTFNLLSKALFIGGIHGLAFSLLLPILKARFIKVFEKLDLSSIDTSYSRKVLDFDQLSLANFDELCYRINQKFLVVTENSKYRKMSFLVNSSFRTLGFGVICCVDEKNKMITFYCKTSRLLLQSKQNSILDQIIKELKE